MGRVDDDEEEEKGSKGQLLVGRKRALSS